MDDGRPTEPFATHRPMLFGLAYRILGSVADADDVVQEAWLRWSADDRSAVSDPRAYLARTVSRVALNHLRARHVRREQYVGPWLPEPLLTGADAAEQVLLDESVSTAMLVVLESLSPVERVVFVMREAFGFPHDEIAEAIGRTPEAVRQIAHRAREHVRARQPRFDTDRRAHEETTRRFMQASAGGDLDGLLELLAPDVVLWADSGGAAPAPLEPLLGAAEVVRFFAGIAPEVARRELRLVEVNGQPAALATLDGQPSAVVGLDLAGGLVSRIRVVVSPAKLAGVAAAVAPGR